MSHADTILELPKGFELLATTESIPVAAFKKLEDRSQKLEVNRPDSYRRFIASKSSLLTHNS
jgi:hypothetical protein